MLFMQLGRTALYRKNSADMVKLLFRKGAHANNKDVVCGRVEFILPGVDYVLKFDGIWNLCVV